MRRLVTGFGDQLRWAARAEVVGVPASAEILVVGMGGSGISGDYLAALAALAGRRVSVAKGYRIPPWAREVRPLVVAMSYSGETEETIAAAAEADAMGLPLVAAATGGFLARWCGERGFPCIRVPGGLQPRAAFGHMLGITVRIAESAGLLSGTAADLGEAAETADVLTGGAGWALAGDLASGLERRLVAVYTGEGLSVPVGTRWKTQVNENAKLPAWTSAIPELDHNEIEAWGAEPDLGARRAGIVALRDRGEPDGVARRFEHTRRAVQGSVDWVGEAWSVGTSPLARMVSLTLIGDMVSVELAERAGVDPLRVRVIEGFKRTMREEQ